MKRNEFGGFILHMRKVKEKLRTNINEHGTGFYIICLISAHVTLCNTLKFQIEFTVYIF